jgi:Protein of unknown function (DUF2795)
VSQPEFIELQKSLAGLSYPPSKDEILYRAQEHEASDEIVKALAGMPDGESDGPNRVCSAVARSS